MPRCLYRFTVSNPCQTYPCQNQHVCLLSSSEPNERACKCPDHLLDVADHESGMSVCHPKSTSQICPLQCNQGLCKMVNGQPKCKCTIDFEGEFCEHYRCSNYCKNRGVCYVDAAHFKAANDSNKPPVRCKCPSGWTGERCDVPVANCSSPCYNGGVCASQETCICAAGFKGSKCQHCEELQCENDGICRQDQLGNAKCECKNDFKGTTNR